MVRRGKRQYEYRVTEDKNEDNDISGIKSYHSLAYYTIGIRLLKKTVYPLAELAGGNSAKNLSKPW